MTRLLLAGEPPSQGDDAHDSLAAWRDALVQGGVLSPDEQLEATGKSTASRAGRMVVVVREQLDQLNSLYCRAVLALETYDGFDPFVDAAMVSGRHHPANELGDLLRATGTDLVVVPYARAHPDEHLPGPVLMTATRLLHKRLLWVRLSRGEDAEADRRAAENLRMVAERDGWDDSSYWGWSPERAAKAAERFAPGNADFAGRVWGTSWPDRPAPRAQTPLDLAASRPALVSAVLAATQQAIHDRSGPRE